MMENLAMEEMGEEERWRDGWAGCEETVHHQLGSLVRRAEVKGLRSDNGRVGSEEGQDEFDVQKEFGVTGQK